MSHIRITWLYQQILYLKALSIRTTCKNILIKLLKINPQTFKELKSFNANDKSEYISDKDNFNKSLEN
jgi:DNA-directed RNA polymerase subunit F